MSRRFVTSSIVSAFVLVACGGSNVVVGKTDTSDQKLQTTKTGGATGNGTTCSWANTSVYDQYGKSAIVPTYALGDEFISIDGCNECDCTGKGIMCTTKSCTPNPCDADAKVCPEGTIVGRSGPNCTFAPCGIVVCTDDVKKCSDGSFVARTAPNCEFAPCGTNDPPVNCPAIAKECPDGSYVGATGPKCEFVCPTVSSCAQIESDAATKLRSAISGQLACVNDDDCENIAITTQCNDNCSAPMAKSGEPAYKSAIESINSNLCVDYQKQGCKLISPSCAPSQPAKCVDKKCQ